MGRLYIARKRLVPTLCWNMAPIQILRISTATLLSIMLSVMRVRHWQKNCFPMMQILKHWTSDPFGTAVPDISTWDPDTIDRSESSKFVPHRGNLHLYWEALATVSLKLLIPQLLMFATKLLSNGD
uniref:Uncharacterized protein n=1 Tax=Macaca fascicularis TaxID=9541 RepID=A0A7N9D1V2_MACFA